MKYAQLINGAWQQLDGRDVAVGDCIASHQTITLWSDAEREAAGIKIIVEDAIPEGKVQTGSSLADDNGSPRRIYTLADAPPPPVPQSISDRQFAHVLAKSGLLTQAEALAWIKVGDVPAALQTIVDGIPNEDARFDAQMLLSGATVFERAHPMTDALASGLGMSSEQVDDIWRQGAQL